jgi:hypothetical protein
LPGAANVLFHRNHPSDTSAERTQPFNYLDLARWWRTVALSRVGARATPHPSVKKCYKKGVLAEESDEAVTTLYRPVGQAELDLIEEAGFTAFPPRLASQPIFYPVTNEAYATRIARDWNTKDGGTGYVTRFKVRTVFLDRYQVHQVGSKEHTEYWILSEDLPTFNRNIVGRIEVIAAFKGDPPERIA